MSRAFILMMDSFGIGASLDAKRFGDEGADTFGHIYEVKEPKLPNLKRLGLFHAHLASTAKKLIALSKDDKVDAMWGYAVENSLGKDTPSGHWELAGVPVMFEWGYFPYEEPCFPKALTDALIKEAGLPGILGNKHASGTVIIDELGEEHIKTGKPICYTSADSVFQIAAHEKHFGLDELYRISEIARRIVDDYNIGRVIARPFIGETKGHFDRTYNRRDYSTPPPDKTLLDYLVDAGREVISVGKIADIYAHSGITQKIKGSGNAELFEKTIELAKSAPEGSLTFTNFVDFDSKYCHRRDIAGYANALEVFDKQLAVFEKAMRPGDIAIITADHGCDPTFPGSDHTREHVPVLAFGPKVVAKFIGRRDSFADIGQSLAEHLGLENPLTHGVSFL